MDYGRVLSRAWQITWRWKVLWILGFLVALGSGAGGGGPTMSSSSNGNMTVGPWDLGQIGEPGGAFWAAFSGVILALLCLGLFIALAIWVLSIIARGGLIAGVVQVEDEGTTSFGQAWRVGVQRFWTLLGVGFLAAIPMFILVFTLLIFFVLGVVAAGGFSQFSEAATGVSIVSLLLCSGVFCCGLIIVAIVLDQIRIYAERAAILEGLGWIDAFKRGWEVIKDHLGPTVILWLIFFALGFVIFGLVIGVMVVVGLPAGLLAASLEPSGWLAAPLCCGGLLAFIFFALLGAVVETFTSATWTLAYRELTGFVPQPVVETVSEA